MEIEALVDQIYEKLKKDPSLIFSENDLTCQMYKELIKDETQRVFTEWSIEKEEKQPGERSSRLDIVTCDKDALVFDGKNSKSIPRFDKVMELKVNWETSGNKMLDDIIKGDYDRLKALGKDMVDKKYMIAFNLCRKDVSRERLLEVRKKLEEANIIFIYKFLNTRELLSP